MTAAVEPAACSALDPCLARTPHRLPLSWATDRPWLPVSIPGSNGQLNMDAAKTASMTRSQYSPAFLPPHFRRWHLHRPLCASPRARLHSALTPLLSATGHHFAHPLSSAFRTHLGLSALYSLRPHHLGLNHINSHLALHIHGAGILPPSPPVLSVLTMH